MNVVAAKRLPPHMIHHASRRADYDLYAVL